MDNLPKEIMDKINDKELVIYILCKYNIDLEEIHKLNRLSYDVLLNHIINRFKINLENEKSEYINELINELNKEDLNNMD